RSETHRTARRRSSPWGRSALIVTSARRAHRRRTTILPRRPGPRDRPEAGGSERGILAPERDAGEGLAAPGVHRGGDAAGDAGRVDPAGEADRLRRRAGPPHV